MRCPHCKGTGEAPTRLRQECLGCQRKVMVSFETTDDLAKHDGRVYCDECKRNGVDARDARL